MNAIGILIFVYAAILIINIGRASLADISFPNEYREAANIQLTMEFLKGKNPYSLSAYSGSVPGIIYVYGPLYSLFTALFFPTRLFAQQKYLKVLFTKHFLSK